MSAKKLIALRERDKDMREELFCLECGARLEKRLLPPENQHCYVCGKNSLLVENLSDWVSVKKKNGEKAFFYIQYAPRCIPNTWVELGTNKDGYNKLVTLLTQDPEVSVIRNDKNREEFEYMRSGYGFQISYIPYVSDLIDPWWDGEPFIEFTFVKKDNPAFPIYWDELQKLFLLLRD